MHFVVCRVSIFFMGKEDIRTGEIKAQAVVCDNMPCNPGV
jgi:hypothetical protein